MNEPDQRFVQADVQRTAPPGDPTGTGGRGDRDAAGRFVAGNVAALVHGARSEQRQTLQSQARRELEDRVLGDLGETRGSATAALEVLVEAFAEASLLRRSAFERLCDLGGPTTTANRPRAVFAVWLSAHDRAVRDAVAIGLERKAKDVGDVASWLSSQETNDGGQAPPGGNDHE